MGGNSYLAPSYIVCPKFQHMPGGAGHRALEDAATIPFPKDCKMSLQSRLQNISTVHCAFHYHKAGDRWSIVDHSDVEEGTLIELLPGFAYPLSHGMRVKTGPITVEVITLPASERRGRSPA